jgi:hypothetical protein
MAKTLPELFSNGWLLILFLIFLPLPFALAAGLREKYGPQMSKEFIKLVAVSCIFFLVLLPENFLTRVVLAIGFFLANLIVWKNAEELEYIKEWNYSLIWSFGKNAFLIILLFAFISLVASTLPTREKVNDAVESRIFEIALPKAGFEESMQKQQIAAATDFIEAGIDIAQKDIFETVAFNQLLDGVPLEQQERIKQSISEEAKSGTNISKAKRELESALRQKFSLGGSLDVEMVRTALREQFPGYLNLKNNFWLVAIAIYMFIFSIIETAVLVPLFILYCLFLRYVLKFAPGAK